MPIPLIVDTDPGVDDAVALMLAVASPEVDLRAVTTVFGNVALPLTTRNAGIVLALAGRGGVPVAAGAARPLVHERAQRAEHVHGSDGLGGRAAHLPAPAAEPDPRGAVAVMAEVLRDSAEPVTIAPIGPLTNVALLLALHPELAPRIGRIVWMGGALGAGNSGAVQMRAPLTLRAAEFNAHCDPEAAHRVLTQSDVPVTMVPLDLTLRCPAGPDWLAALDAGGPRGHALAQVIGHYRAVYRERYGHDAVALHDAVAVLEAIVPGSLRTTPLPVQVACDLGPARGATVPTPDSDAPPVAVALDADVDAVLAAVLDRVGRLH